MAQDADALAQAELLLKCGYKATLVKVRYSDQKPQSPKTDKRKV